MKEVTYKNGISGNFIIWSIMKEVTYKNGISGKLHNME